MPHLIPPAGKSHSLRFAAPIRCVREAMRLLGRLCPLALFAVAGNSGAQTLVLDTFDSPGGSGAIRPNTSWVGNVTQNPSSITVGGTALSDNGWGTSGQSLNATGMNYVTLVAQRNAGHTASVVVLQFEDFELDTFILTLSAALFATNTLTQVTLPLPAFPATFDPTRIIGWNLGGGTTGISEFRMTFSDLALSATIPPAHHSADSNKDGRIALFELTRVIELFNTRQGATRTGCYGPSAASEDGFQPEPARSANETVTLTAYHASDSNRDGKIGLFELTRLIELFNYRSGTARTGQYHAQSGTEDGFAPGP